MGGELLKACSSSLLFTCSVKRSTAMSTALASQLFLLEGSKSKHLNKVLPGSEPLPAQCLLSLQLRELFSLKIWAHVRNRKPFRLCGAHTFNMWNMSSDEPSGYSNVQRFCSLYLSQRATIRACPCILSARLAALPESSLGSWIAQRTWPKAHWSQWMIFYWSKPLNCSSTSKANCAKFLLSTYQDNTWISLLCLFFFFFLLFCLFFWTLNYLIQRDFPSIKLLASLNAVASSRKMSNRQKSRRNSKWTVNGASLTHQQPGEREQTTNYCTNNYNIKNNNKKS